MVVIKNTTKKAWLPRKFVAHMDEFTLSIVSDTNLKDKHVEHLKIQRNRLSSVGNLGAHMDAIWILLVISKFHLGTTPYLATVSNINYKR